MIAVVDLSLRAGAFALNGVSFTVSSGEYAVLMGRTGSGKTKLLEAICGLHPVHSGSICLLGRDVTHCKPAERGVGYVPQDLALFPSLTVREHLAFALTVRRWPRTDVEQRVGELAELLGLGSLLDRTPHGLSGGEAQRVALGRALSFRPPVLLLDEPLSALDEESRDDLVALLRSVQRRTNVTTLHVTHSLTEARKLGDRLLRIDQGVIRAGPMRITIRYAAQVRHAAGRADEQVELDGPCPLSELVRLLAARHGSPLRELILDSQGQTQPALLLFVGDEQVEPGREPTLHDGAEVTLLAPMAGG